MDIERLKELQGEVSNVAFIALSKLVDKNARANVVKFGEDLQELIDETIARQSVKSEEVAEAIDMLQVIRPSEREIKSGEYPDIADAINLAITALQAYQPTTRKDRTVEEVAISKTETTSCEEDHSRRSVKTDA